MSADAQLKEAICLAALELADPAQRAAFLERACAGDERLRAEVGQMLSLHADAEKFFARGAAAVASAERDLPPAKVAAAVADATLPGEPGELPGSRVGRYQLLQRLGEGGCGTVYLAEQEEPVRRRVAVKVIKPGMDTRSVVARFEAERQALAMMDHPNIARVLDAGATESGHPYFVMELVQGVRITRFCDEHNFDTRQRLELFIQICRAIQHAHQKGIIHRDLKPSNILVALDDGVPVPKVIDFGIAKATEGKLAGQTLFTPCEQLVGTPAYMSPEQAEMSGLDVDTRSDIYSLGVLLYELLTGRTPFDSKTLLESGLDEMRKTLREKEPPAPSTMVTSLHRTELNATAGFRHAEPPKLISLLKGDLDWIVLKALEKNRARRYETAHALAMDVQRYLNNEPVAARPPSRRYRLQKLIWRNKIVFVAGGIVAVTLIMGLGTSISLLLREREAKREQAHLREQAEQSEKRENELRQQAEAREKINQAAVFVSQEKFDAASRLLDQVKTPPPKPSLDGVSAYRSVGEWLALQGRWTESADRFSALMEIDKLDKWGAVTLDYQAYGVVLLESGKREQYAEFCRTMVEGFGPTTNGDAAGRVLKTCLLAPPDGKLREEMKPLGGAAENFFMQTNSKLMGGWPAIPVALWRYRGGDYEPAAEWCRQGLDGINKTSAQYATLQMILAMCSQHAGQTNEARMQLSPARDLIEAKFQNNLERGDSGLGYWYDWLFARVLLREASALAGEN